MATDDSDAALDHTTVVPRVERRSTPGIAHLTVVPENADQSSWARAVSMILPLSVTRLRKEVSCSWP